ncbi:MAG: mce [Chloroflexi bacterium]|nr:mce [Chloroflexota bacterium]
MSDQTIQPPAPSFIIRHEPTRVRHVSVAVRSISEALRFYRDAMGLSVNLDMDVSGASLRLVRLNAHGTEIQLMEPTDADGSVGQFLERRGEGLHHLTFEVDDIELELRTLLARGIELIDREPRDGPDGRVAFVHPRSTSGVLIELFERWRPIPPAQAPTTDRPDSNEPEPGSTPSNTIADGQRPEITEAK